MSTDVLVPHPPQIVGQPVIDCPPDEHLRLSYQEVCRTYHQIDDFRGKLLALLPLASGTGIFLLLQPGLEITGLNGILIGLFGFFATLGLLVYELTGINHCIAIIERGKQLEEALQLTRETGQFLVRPKAQLGLIHTPVASYTVYGTTLMAWLAICAIGLGILP